MKKFTVKNLITGEYKETICVNTLAAAQEYFDAMYPYLGSNWMMFEVK